MARILNGKEVAKSINEQSKEKVQTLNDLNIIPTLAIFRVGEKDADISYEKGAMKRCEEIGVKVINYHFPENVETEEFYTRLNEANNDNNIHGILVFRPLPKDRFIDDKLRNMINFKKDVDGCSDLSLAGIFTNKSQGHPPCTAKAAIEILDYYDIDIDGKNIVIIGRSLVIGKPVSMMLLNRNATVTICHTKTQDLASIAAKADILICSAGRMEMVTKEYTNPNQVIIDVGIDYNQKKQKLCGDVLYEEVEPLVNAITPVPGGVGAVTTSVLVKNVIDACFKLNNIHD